MHFVRGVQEHRENPIYLNRGSNIHITELLLSAILTLSLTRQAEIFLLYAQICDGWISPFQYTDLLQSKLEISRTFASNSFVGTSCFVLPEKDICITIK